MWRTIIFAGLLTIAASTEVDKNAAITDVSEVKGTNTQTIVQEIDDRADKVEDDKSKRSPIAATAIYGSSPQHQGQYVIRHGDDAQEVGPEYIALLQQYLEVQPQQAVHGHHQHQAVHQQPQPQPQHLHTQRIRLGALLEQELARLIERPGAVQHKHHQIVPLEVEQYHVETTPRRVPVAVQQQQLYYPIEEVQIQPQSHHHQQQHHQHQLHHQQQHAHPVTAVPVAVTHRPEPVEAQPQAQAQPQPQTQLRYHQSIPIQYGYEDEQQVRHQQQNPESIVRAQAQAEAQALAFHKIAQAAHYKHQDDALEQIRVANEKHRQQSALEQIRQGEQLSEAGRQERIPPKDPETAYKARLKAQATALVADQRRAHEAAEYKAHADAILKLQAQQQAHLRAQEEAHRYALNFEKNQQRAQAQAQAIANAQALALYQAHQAARAKAQAEAKQAAKAQADAKKLDPDNAPVIQYLLPNKVPLPHPDVYLPKAAEALREAALQEKRLKKAQNQIKHQILLEEIDPQLLRRLPKPEDHQEPTQELTFLVDADYFRKAQVAQQQHEQQQQQQHVQQRPLLRPASRYQSIEEPSNAQQSRYQSYHGQIDPEKLALLVPVEHHQTP